MKTFDDERRLVPLWRTFNTTARNRELEGIATPRKVSLMDKGSWFFEKVREFEVRQSILSAYELLSAAIVAGEDNDAKRAAHLLAKSPDISSNLRKLVVNVLEGNVRPAMLLETDRREAIAARRTWLRAHPRDAIVWMELALFYSTVAEGTKARHCVEAALTVAPSNRYILRSSVRHFLHEDNPDHAFRILERSNALLRDPWLAAAGLVVQEIMGRRPRKIKVIRELLNADVQDHNLSELRGALGSLEYGDGSQRKARKLFIASLKDPTENVVAQLNWYRAKNRILIDYPPGVDHAQENCEARVWRYAADKNWDAAVKSCWGWANLEPFSSRPYLLGSYWSCVTHDNPVLGRTFAQRGLQANPWHSGLLNNLAFSYARSGALSEGEAWYKKAKFALRKDEDFVALWALDGLWAYRKGDIERGRNCYAEAMALCAQDKSRMDACRLALHWVEEEVDRGTEAAKAAALAVMGSNKYSKEAEIEAMRERIERKMKALPQGSMEPKIQNALRQGDFIK